MKIRFISTLLIVFTALTTLYGQPSYSLKSYKASIAGTSNLHDWTAQIGKLALSTDLSESAGEFKLTKVSLVIDANSFAGSKGGIMDKKIKEVFESNKHPQLKINLTKASVSKATGKVASIALSGTAEVRKQIFPISLNAKATILPNGDIDVVATKSLKMSDVGLKAPVAMLGALKTADDVSLEFRIVLKKN